MLSIETDRLLLREWMPEDLTPLSLINQDSKVTEFLLTPIDSAALLKNLQSHFTKFGYGLFACTVKETSEMIGFVGLNCPTYNAHFTPCVEVAWRLAAKTWGKGYATEAATAVLKEAFETYGLTEVVALTVPANSRSRRIMEKLGMTHSPEDDFLHPNVPLDHHLSRHVLYRLIKEQFENRL